MTLEILIFYGPAQNNGNEIKVVNFVTGHLKKRGHKAVFIDPAEYVLSVDEETDQGRDLEITPESLIELADQISRADAFVVVSGEENHSVPKPLTDLMDNFLEEYFFRPSGIISYSADKFGGVRAAMQLRSFLSEIGTVSIPTQIPIPSVQNTFDSEDEPVNPDYHRFMDQFIDDLEWYALSLREGRNARVLPY